MLPPVKWGRSRQAYLCSMVAGAARWLRALLEFSHFFLKKPPLPPLAAYTHRGLQSRKDLQLSRLECGRLLLSVEEDWRQPRLFEQNMTQRTCFDSIILNHHRAREKLKKKRSVCVQAQTCLSINACVHSSFGLFIIYCDRGCSACRC